jgi:ABC-type glycerol-3-phosphate transport system substrate-binding protein
MDWLVRARQAMGGRAAIDALRQANQGKDLFVEVRKQAIVHHNYSIYFSWPQTAPDLRFGAFAIVPQQRGAGMALPHKSAWGWGMMSTAKEKDAAWLLVKKMTVDEDGGGYLQVQQGRPSPIRKVNESGEFKSQNPYWQVVVKTMEQRWKRPASFVPPEATKAFADTVAKIAGEDVAPRAGLTEGAVQVQAILDQYWATRR